MMAITANLSLFTVKLCLFDGGEINYFLNEILFNKLNKIPDNLLNIFSGLRLVYLL